MKKDSEHFNIGISVDDVFHMPLTRNHEHRNFFSRSNFENIRYSRELKDMPLLSGNVDGTPLVNAFSKYNEERKATVKNKR